MNSEVHDDVSHEMGDPETSSQEENKQAQLTVNTSEEKVDPPIKENVSDDDVSLTLDDLKDDAEKNLASITSSAKTQAHSNNNDCSEESSPERFSSLELRKRPISNLLMPKTMENSSSSMDLKACDEKNQTNTKGGLLKMTCLNPKFELRTQLMLSFGSVNFITIFLVVLICVIVSLKTGDNIKAINTETFSTLAQDIQGRTARYLAESLEHRIYPRDAVQIMYEVTRDRFQGYPTFQDDSQVPFRNMDNNESVYPVVGAPVPLDWQIANAVTQETNQEHTQGRLSWYAGRPVSTSTGSMVMQGSCDPSQTDPESRTYWPNCTDANNDISTGGVVRPSNLTEMIHRKASDLVPTMKALYEYNRDIRDMGIAFPNQGVGATLSFPQYEVDANSTYTSVGCEWMKEPNPYDPSRPIGTQEEIDQCYKEGTVVSSREYNPLGRGWCRDQALHPEKILVDGPFLSAWAESDWVLTTGRAIYDRVTKDLLACTFVGMSIGFLQGIMKESLPTPNSEVSVVRWGPEGAVVASSAGNATEVPGNTAVDLHVGLTNDTYSDLYNLVDYNTKWDPFEVQVAYEDFTSSADGFFVAAYPIPPVPDEYDPTYRPVFLSIVSTATADVFDKVDEVNEDVDERTNQAMLFAVVVGAVGFVLATIVILITATAITRPLQLMNKEAGLIVGSFGDDGSDVQQIKPIHVKYARCVPRTEITDVVSEFNRMISSFSGSLMAKTERGKFVEIINLFNMRSDFMSLYESRKGSNLPPGVVVTDPVTVPEDGAVSVVHDGSISSPLQFVHLGTNLQMARPVLGKVLSSDDLRKSGQRKTSSLFIWIVILIVTPLLLTTITISAVVLRSMSREFDESVKESEQHYLDVALQALSVYTRLRADFVSTYTSRSVRDLYLMTRVSSWILFGGLGRADSFTKTYTAVNKCLDGIDLCLWINENRFCDCAWNYDGQECEEYPDVLSRSNQIPYFFVSSDAALQNGTRLTTDFPLNSVSPNTTLWWDGPYDLPGSDHSGSVSGLSTTFDRLRVISAFPLFPVLVNYDVMKENSIGHYFTFEEDGLMLGNEGCLNSRHPFVAFWQSTEENGAEALRPELCPLGKYGYDPRCRGWYETGKKRALKDTSDNIHITAPYLFADDTAIGQSATSAINDPRTNSYVGQVLLDFAVTDIFSVLTSSSTPLSDGGFPLLITVESSLSEGDTVIGPGLNGSVSSLPVSQVVLKFDQDCQGDDSCTERKREFTTIVESMKAGNKSLSMFERGTADGGKETVYMATAPVNVDYLNPIDASDFARGAIVGNHLTYSLSLAETRQGMLEPFAIIEQDMQSQINIAIGILAAVIVVAVVATIGISYVVARSISEPMQCLLELIRLLNSHDVDQDPPMIDQTMGSKEIVNVSNTMESLYRVVRLANMAFYLGDLEAAYRILVDVLRLYKRMDNKKAIGVACNNLGNTMLTMYREMQIEGVESRFGLTRQDIIARATVYFSEAIQLGEKAYDEFHEVEGWSPNCLDFMQHLSNRYFNRAIFLLTVKDDHPQPQEIQNLGYRDLDVARDMDAEIEAQGQESGWGNVNRSEKLFNVQLVRLRGYMLLLELGYSDVWEIDEKLQDLFQMLADEAKKPSSDLFQEVRYVGRLQQAETEMMKYLLLKGEVAAAARIAIRMLMEDERIFLEAEARAVKVLQAYIESKDFNVNTTVLLFLRESLDDILKDIARQNDKKQVVASTRTHCIASKSLRNVGEFFKRSPSSSTKQSVSDNSAQFVTMEKF